MSIHAGKLVKEVFSNSGMSVSELGRRIQTSRQNVYRIFERPSIDTALLKRLGEALQYDFFRHFINPLAEGSLPDAEILNAEKSKTVLYKEAENLQRELSDLKEKYKLVQRVNELLEKDAAKCN